METMLGFLALGITSVLALFAALALQSLLLKATLALMQPAAAVCRPAPQPIEHGTQLLVHAYAKRAQ